jgi:hypothetical protein
MLLRMRLLAPVVAAAMVAASLPFVAHTSAGAAVSATSCSSNEKQDKVKELSVPIVRVVAEINPVRVTSYIQLWYSPTCRYVWAEEGGVPLQGDHIWVYNEDTGHSANAYYPSTATDAIDDAGTFSHACLENTTAAPIPGHALTISEETHHCRAGMISTQAPAVGLQ